ncbi:MAG: hypothetical protein WCD49_03805 [Candidatus Acidiferrales bacterium]
MGAVFRVLLYLYPQRHRELLGAEMQAVFERGAQEHRLLGPSQYLRFVLLEVGGLVLHAVIAQFANATHRSYLENQVHGTLPPAQDLPDEVIEAQNRVAVNLNQLLSAISHHQFVQARFYKNEERKAREYLRQMQEKYGMGDPQSLP